MDWLSNDTVLTELVLLVILLVAAVGGAITGVLIWHEFRRPPESRKDEHGRDHRSPE